MVTSFIEVIPSDTVKYEIDKKTGYLKIDRPQKFSNIVPALYGFILRTYCKDQVAAYCMEQTGRKDIVGGDAPLDICVLTEREVTHGNIIAVLDNDEVYSAWDDVKDLPPSIVRRLQH